MQKIIVEQGGLTKELNVENNYSTNGWTAIFANVADGTRVVQKIIDLVGGTGTKPSGIINKYMGQSGLVSNIADATNIKGADGSSADITVNNISAVEGNITLTATDVGADIEGAADQAEQNANDYTDQVAAKKADLIDGLVPANQLPSYVDDVLEYPNLASFPEIGATGKIYVALDTNLTYRWTGSIYAALDPSLALGENSQTAYRGDRGKTAYDHSLSTGNPHGTTISDISGLQNALDAKATIANQRYSFVADASSTYTVPSSAVTENGRVIIKLSNSSLTSVTIDTNTGAGKAAGDSFNVLITGTYAAQTLAAGGGVTLNGTLAFSAAGKIKTVVYEGSNVWTVLGG